MNLVMAIMVETSMAQSSADKEAKAAWELATRKKAIPQLREMFSDLDADGSGELEVEEIINAPPAIQKRLWEVTGMQDVTELYKLLEILRIMKQCNDIMDAGREMHVIIQDMEAK